MPLKLRRLAVILALALASGCDPDFSPDWGGPVDPPLDRPDAAGLGMDAGEDAAGASEMDTGAELEGGLMDAGLSPSDVVVMPLPVFDCSVVNPCSDGGDAAGCESYCVVSCRDVPCWLSPSSCNMPGDCKLSSCNLCGVIPK